MVEAIPYKWPHDGTISTASTALVIIDMQRDFCEAGGYLSQQTDGDVQLIRAIIPNISALLSAARLLNFTIYYTRAGHRPDLSTLPSQGLFRSRNNSSGLGIGDIGPLGRFLVRGEPGHDIIHELSPLYGESVIDKPGQSAFYATDFMHLLTNTGIRNLIICGVTTDQCVISTMRDANDRGFDCLLVEDACAATNERLHAGAVDMVKGHGGILGAVASTQDILIALESLQEMRETEATGSTEQLGNMVVENSHAGSQYPSAPPSYVTSAAELDMHQVGEIPTRLRHRFLQHTADGPRVPRRSRFLCGTSTVRADTKIWANFRASFTEITNAFRASNNWG